MFVTCPLEEEHSDGYDAQVKDTMVIFDADGGIGFHCLHEHQDAPNGPGYTDSDFKEWLFNETELDYRTAKSASVDDFEDLDEKDDGDWLGEEDDEDDWVGDQDAEDDRVGDQDAEAELKKRMEARRVPSAKSLVPTMDEVRKAKLTARCIVENYLYADVAQLVAAGGVGKTTLVLLEMIHIALGRELWGLKVVSPGKTLLVTAEDEKEMLLARMRELMDAMDLTDEEQLYVIQHALIWDATETGRKLAKVEDYSGMMLVSDLAYEIAVKYAGEEFQVVTFDPTISFGASEARVNDNEQALVMAARVIKHRLKCCVRYIHHTGQDNAREKRLDQYAGRNGTALPDGTRMTAVMHPVVPDEKMKWQGAEETLPASLVADRRAYMVLSRPKLSYAPPQPLLWIARDGWSFEGEVGKVVTPVEREQAEYAKLNTFLLEELKLGQTHTINSLKEKVRDHGVKRASVDRIVKRMVRAGLTDEAELPRELRAGPKTKYLRPAEYSGVALPGEENWPSGEAI